MNVTLGCADFEVRVLVGCEEIASAAIFVEGARQVACVVGLTDLGDARNIAYLLEVVAQAFREGEFKSVDLSELTGLSESPLSDEPSPGGEGKSAAQEGDDTTLPDYPF